MTVSPIAVPDRIERAIRSAGERSGVDFDYLLKTAIRESSLDPSATARTSSATGLFQFIESTWLAVLKEEGPTLGYGKYSALIERRSDGGYVVSDPSKKSEILALRKEPQIAADLAAAHTRRNGQGLLDTFGRMPSQGELYIAHFLGVGGAERLIRHVLEDQTQVAKELFPRPAAANKSLFFEGDKALTVGELYGLLISKHAPKQTVPLEVNIAARADVPFHDLPSTLMAQQLVAGIPSVSGNPSAASLFSLDHETVSSRETRSPLAIYRPVAAASLYSSLAPSPLESVPVPQPRPSEAVLNSGSVEPKQSRSAPGAIGDPEGMWGMFSNQKAYGE